MSGDGPTDTGIMLVGEAPGPDEDEQGVPFVGRVGRFQDRHILSAVDATRKDFRLTNAVRCYPGKDNQNKIRNPNITQIRACNKYLVEEIELCKPKVIVAMGNPALHSLIPINRKLDDDEKEVTGVTGITKWRAGLPIATITFGLHSSISSTRYLLQALI